MNPYSCWAARLLPLALLLAQAAVSHAALPGKPVAHESETLHAIQARQASRLLWSQLGKPTPQATQLLDLLRRADSYGLRSADYSTAPTADWKAFDDQLTIAAIRFITHLHYGRVNPRAAGFEFKKQRDDLDVANVVAQLSHATDVSAAIAAIEPPFHHYTLLKLALARYRTLAMDDPTTRLPAPERRKLSTGDTYAGASVLRQLLTALGDLPSTDLPTPTDTQTLDPGLVAALKRFQNRHGLQADGTLGPQTYRALTTPLATRVRQIELTLERWRWLPLFDTPPVIVNIPQFQLFAFSTNTDRYADITQMPVIVGKEYPHTRTPVFIGEMKHVIFRPYWDVPRSITVRELLPAIRANSDYLRRNNLEMVRGEGDDGQVVSPSPETIAALAAGQLRLRQRPGEDNALGLIKFVFPNEHHVYMHSTPAHQLFLQARRAFSHGCIRVSDPITLADYVLHNAAGNWDNASISAAMHGADNVRVQLSRPIRVMILYGTALATEAGPVMFFDDIYGHDRKLAKLLGLAP